MNVSMQDAANLALETTAIALYESEIRAAHEKSIIEGQKVPTFSPPYHQLSGVNRARLRARAIQLLRNQ